MGLKPWDQIRIKISNVVDVLADKGISQLKPLKEKLEHLSQEEQDLVREEKRLEQEISAEKRQAGSAHEQIQTLHLFNTPHFMAKVGALLLIVLGIINLINEFFPAFPIKLRIPGFAHHKMAELMDRGSAPAALK